MLDSTEGCVALIPSPLSEKEEPSMLKSLLVEIMATPELFENMLSSIAPVEALRNNPSLLFETTRELNSQSVPE